MSGCRSRILLFASIVTQIVANSLFLSHSVKCMSQLQAQDHPGFQLPPPQLFLAGVTVVSQQALLQECATHFPELFRWVFLCYGQHPILWHSMGTLGSKQGIQQGTLWVCSCSLWSCINLFASDSDWLQVQLSLSRVV